MDQRAMMAAGMQYLQNGRLKDAETLYRQVLANDPKNAEATHLMGVCAIGMGENEAALRWIDAAILLDGGRGDFHGNRTLTLFNLGRVNDTIAAAAEALRLGPPNTMVLNVFGNALQATGRLDEAIECFNRAIALQPGEATAYCNLGNALRGKRRADEAVEACCKAISIQPGFAEAYSNLGNALRDLGKTQESIAAYQRALELRPDFVEAGNNLGAALFDAKRFDEAEAIYRRALAMRPAHAPMWNNLGNVLHEKRRFDEAVECYRKALELEPTYAGALSNLGMALKDLGRIHEAVECYVRLGPDDLEAQSHRLQMLHYLPEWDGQALLRELRAWGREQIRRAGEPVREFTNNRNGERRLRIGYVTADYNDHVAGRNALPLLREHDRERFEIFCYSNARRTDALTERFRSLGNIWRDITQMDDRAAAAMARADGIDILVDLSVHSTGNRLPIFAYTPAPVQATFCGYPGGTGLETIEYRLSDPYLDPAENDGDYVERTERLARSFWCYDAVGMELAAMPEVNEAPMTRSGHVTFGCLTHQCKINRELLGLWRRVLEATPGSRILLLGMPGSQRDWLTEQLLGRADFEEMRVRPYYMQLYNRVDIALDTFPYNGHTTSLDSYWMGVPVVTRVGKTAVSRAGWSQLNNLGLTELAAKTEDEFVRIAAGLAADGRRVRDLRSTMRDRMKSSPLMDAAGFARDVEAVYRRIWKAWALR